MCNNGQRASDIYPKIYKHSDWCIAWKNHHLLTAHSLSGGM